MRAADAKYLAEWLTLRLRLNDLHRCADNQSVAINCGHREENEVARRTEEVQTGEHADGVYLGLMSGTSMDGVDGVAVQFAEGRAPVVLAEAHVGFSEGLRNALFDL